MASEDVAKGVAKLVFPGIQGGPLCHIIAAKAVAFGEALTPEFKKYAQQILDNTQALAKGLLAQDFKLSSGGTDNHLVLADVGSRDMAGGAAEKILESVGIVANRNVIPGDELSPGRVSGIRFGTAAVATRGMGKAEILEIADMIDTVLSKGEEPAVLDRTKERVAELCQRFPVYV